MTRHTPRSHSVSEGRRQAGPEQSSAVIESDVLYLYTGRIVDTPLCHVPTSDISGHMMYYDCRASQSFNPALAYGIHTYIFILN